MSTAVKEAKESKQDDLPRSPYLPVNLEDRAKEKKRIREEQLARLPRMLDCLDPTVAKTYEDRKPLYEWSIKVRLFRPSIGKIKARMEDVERNVVAQDERDAWATFCDLIGEWPSIRGANPTITRLKRSALRDSSVDASTDAN